MTSAFACLRTVPAGIDTSSRPASSTSRGFWWPICGSSDRAVIVASIYSKNTFEQQRITPDPL